MSSVNWSSAVIKWKKIPDVPGDLSDRYQYVIEYQEGGSNVWTEWQTKHSHNAPTDQYQEDTLTGLTNNTLYVVRVKSYRTLEDVRDEAGFTPFTVFNTCPGKSRGLHRIYSSTWQIVV